MFIGAEMSTTIATIKGCNCSCGDAIENVYVDYFDCGGYGLTLKTSKDWVPLSPQMVADLVDALIDYQNKE